MLPTQASKSTCGRAGEKLFSVHLLTDLTARGWQAGTVQKERGLCDCAVVAVAENGSEKGLGSE